MTRSSTFMLFLLLAIALTLAMARIFNNDHDHAVTGKGTLSNNVHNNDDLVITDVQKAAAVELLTTTNVWKLLQNIWKLFHNEISKRFGDQENTTTSLDEPRTFGKIRRLQMALIPLAFKFGVLFSMITFLVMLGMKTLFLVKILVLLNILALLSKFFTLKLSHENHYSHVSSPGYWIPDYNHHHHSIGKEVHLHVNAATPPSSHIIPSYSSNSGWDRKTQTFVQDPSEWRDSIKEPL